MPNTFLYLIFFLFLFYSINSLMPHLLPLFSYVFLNLLYKKTSLFFVTCPLIIGSLLYRLWTALIAFGFTQSWTRDLKFDQVCGIVQQLLAILQFIFLSLCIFFNFSFSIFGTSSCVMVWVVLNFWSIFGTLSFVMVLVILNFFNKHLWNIILCYDLIDF